MQTQLRTPNAREHLNHGLRYYAKGRKREALDRYRIALEIEPDNTLARYLVGLTLRALGRADAAKSEWETVLYLPVQTPDDAWAKTMARKLLEDGIE